MSARYVKLPRSPGLQSLTRSEQCDVSLTIGSVKLYHFCHKSESCMYNYNYPQGDWGGVGWWYVNCYYSGNHRPPVYPACDF